jgi:hypothetical protein
MAFEIERMDAKFGGGAGPVCGDVQAGVHGVPSGPGSSLTRSASELDRTGASWCCLIPAFRDHRRGYQEQTNNLYCWWHEERPRDQAGREMKECLLKGDFLGSAQGMNKLGFKKARLADSDNTDIDQIVEVALEAGAQASKGLRSAGGGELSSTQSVASVVVHYGGTEPSSPVIYAMERGWKIM